MKTYRWSDFFVCWSSILQPYKNHLFVLEDSVDTLVCSIQTVLLYAFRDSFSPFSPICMHFIFLSCLISLTFLKRNDENGHPCLFLSLGRMTLSTSLLTMMLSVGSFVDALLIKLKKFPSNTCLFRVLKYILDFVKCIFSINSYNVFSSFNC